MAMGPKRWSKIGSISRGWGCILEWFCRVGIYSQSQVKKSEALKMILNMCRTVYSSSQKTRHELIRGGLCFTRQASILHAECFCQKDFHSWERLFQTWTNKTSGWHWEHLPSSISGATCQTKRIQCWQYLWPKKASMWGASCQTRQGFALRTVVTKGIHFGGILL